MSERFTVTDGQSVASDAATVEGTIVLENSEDPAGQFIISRWNPQKEQPRRGLSLDTTQRLGFIAFGLFITGRSVESLQIMAAAALYIGAVVAGGIMLARVAGHACEEWKR